MLLFDQTTVGSELVFAEKVLNNVGENLERIKVELNDENKRKFGSTTIWYNSVSMLNALAEYEEHADSSEFFKIVTLRNMLMRQSIDVDNSRGIQIGKKRRIKWI